LGTYIRQGYPGRIGNRVKYPWRQLEELEQLAELFHFLLRFSAAATLLADYLFSAVVLALKRGKTLLRLYRIRAGFGFLVVI